MLCLKVLGTDFPSCTVIPSAAGGQAAAWAGWAIHTLLLAFEAACRLFTYKKLFTPCMCFAQLLFCQGIKTPCALRRGCPVGRAGPRDAEPDITSKRADKLAAPPCPSSCMGPRPPPPPPPPPPPRGPPPPAPMNGLLSTPLVGMCEGGARPLQGEGGREREEGEVSPISRQDSRLSEQQLGHSLTGVTSTPSGHRKTHTAPPFRAASGR
jgi:hypothetical protein